MKICCLLVLICLCAGCSSTAPLQKDKKYPAAWPEISTLDFDGRGLEGSYANEGVTSHEAKKTILLTDILPKAAQIGPSQAKIVSLKVVPGMPGSRRASQAKLQIILHQGDVRYRYECDCTCVNGNVFYLQSNYGGVVPYIYMGGGSVYVALSKAVDGSLIAKITNSDVGLIVIVPFYSASGVWARFPRVGD